MEESTRNLILSLSAKQAVTFAALTCEKLYVNYEIFTIQEAWGEPELYVEAISHLYGYVLGLNQSTDEHGRMLARIEEIFPDLDEFEGITASYALDACVALHEAVSFLLDNQVSHIVNCSTAATDTVDMFVQEILDLNPNDTQLEDIITRNGFMIKEKQRQVRILENLAVISNFESSVIEVLRELNTSDNIVELSELLN